MRRPATSAIGPLGVGPLAGGPQVAVQERRGRRAHAWRYDGPRSSRLERAERAGPVPAPSSVRTGARAACRSAGTAGQQVVPVEQLDVEVAGGPGDRLDPLEGVALPGQRLGGEGARQLAQHRAAAPHRHPQVVEELGVEVGERAGQVGLDHAGQVAQHRHRRLVGALVGAQVDPYLGADALGIAPRCGDGLVGQAGGRVDQARLGRQHRHHPGQRLGVAEHAGDLEPGRERHRLRRRVERRVGGQPHAHDGLEVGVAHRSGCTSARTWASGQQRPHLDDRGQAVAAADPRAGRSPASACGARPGAGTGPAARLLAQHQGALVAARARATDPAPASRRRRSAVSTTVKVTAPAGSATTSNRLARNDTSAGGSTPSGRANE